MKMQSLTTLTVLMFIGLARGAVKCPAGYVNIATGCYRFTEQSGMTWDHAYLICIIEMSGYLVEIQNAKEQNALRSYIEDIIDPSITYDWWIGIADTSHEGDYRFVTSGKQATYLPWYSSTDPNDAPPGEDCVGISANLAFKWRDYRCNIGSFGGRPFKAICEADPI